MALSLPISRGESPTTIPKGQPPDHFVCRDGVEFAGTHVFVDLWEASRLDEIPYMEAVLREVVDTCRASLIHLHLHHFTPTGISGVAVLAESHISVHTWPERGFAAFDVFMSGEAQPQLAIPIFERAFSAGHVNANTVCRGVVESVGVFEA